MGLFQKAINKVVLWNISHNFVFNKILIALGLEKKVTHKFNPYHAFKPDENKTPQEIAGYSNRIEINEVIEKSKKDLTTCVEMNVKSGGKILDIGCGPGMYLKLFEGKYDLTGTDINKYMLEVASKYVKGAKFYEGDFTGIDVKGEFDLIYCIGVLIYIPRTDIKTFFQKIHGLLNKGGVLYLNYPHALSYGDTLYSNLNYIQYSPEFIDKIIRSNFEIIEHHHAFDGRVVASYDKQPYKSLNPNTHRTYKNSYLLIAKKK